MKLFLIVFGFLFLGYFVISFTPIVLSTFRFYRRIVGGRWEKRGHWHRYDHCDVQTNARVEKYGNADNVEDWF